MLIYFAGVVTGFLMGLVLTSLLSSNKPSPNQNRGSNENSVSQSV